MLCAYYDKTYDSAYLFNDLKIAAAKHYPEHLNRYDVIYLEFLRSLFKNSGTTSRIFAAVYMTGILPIKKDGSQSAISDFEEKFRHGLFKNETLVRRLLFSPHRIHL